MTMKNLPRPKFYTIEELAKEWGFEVSRVQSLVADGHLKWKDDDILLEDVLRIFATLEPEVDEIYLPPASYVISLEEIERFENEYDLAGPATKETPPIVTAPPPNIIESLPRESEKPLRGMKAVAEYCGVVESTIKDWRKKFKDFPVSSPGSGIVTALQSELNAWMINRGKK
jgi:predicted DNA-binding transcriptional regulator AlpA